MAKYVMKSVEEEVCSHFNKFSKFDDKKLFRINLKYKNNIYFKSEHLHGLLKI